jgi:hypothetical protein
MSTVPVAADIGTDGLVLYQGTTPIEHNLGCTDVLVSDSNGYGLALGDKLTLPENGKFTKLYLYITQVTNARAAIYNYDAVNARPGNLLVESGSEACSASAWHLFDLADTDIVAGTIYLMFQTSLNANTTKINAVATGYNRYYKSYAYAAFPNPFGAGTPVANQRTSIYAVYETTETTERLYSNVNGTVVSVLLT